MNIFYLDTCPIKAASYMCDKHVIKMILESAQMLSTAHRLLGDDQVNEVLYKVTHKNHPSAKWVRENESNYLWLLDHFIALSRLYQTWRGRIHLTTDKLLAPLSVFPKNIPTGSQTIPPLAMPAEFKMESVVDSYRAYYRWKETQIDMRWSANRVRPNWMNENNSY